MPLWYCKLAKENPLHAPYHDKEYGFPATDERVLFERFCLEIMQAGLSWELVVKKRKALNKAFDRFSVSKVAAYGEKDVERLLGDASIIRNRRKIEAIIENANIIKGMRATHGGFAGWLAAHRPRGKERWIKLFGETFTFTGGEIVNEFLMSLGILPGAHVPSCPMYKVVKKAQK